MTDANQASEDELLKKIDSIMPQCGEIDCTTCTKRHKRVLALLRNEKLKLLAEVRERVVGAKNDLYFKNKIPQTLLEYMDDVVKVREQLREDQRAELDKLEAEL